MKLCLMDAFVRHTKATKTTTHRTKTTICVNENIFVCCVQVGEFVCKVLDIMNLYVLYISCVNVLY